MHGRLWGAARGLFLLAVAAAVWWSWQRSGPDVAAALGEVDLNDLLVAQVLVVAGLAATGWVWRTALAAYGVHGGPTETVAPFFVAQLGKYIPGAVWSFAAQGAVGSRRGVPARLSVAAAVLFLLVHLSSGLVFAGILGGLGALEPRVAALSLVVGLVGLLPAVYRLLGERLAGCLCPWTLRRSVLGLSMMMAVWGLYSFALIAVAPTYDLPTFLAVGTAFAIAHAAGIVVPIAPAGLGARDGMLIVLLSPVLGPAPAASLAIVARLLHTLADLMVAGISWWLMRMAGGQSALRPGRPRH